jgi:hypothetical protein
MTPGLRETVNLVLALTVIALWIPAVAQQPASMLSVARPALAAEAAADDNWPGSRGCLGTACSVGIFGGVT